METEREKFDRLNKEYWRKEYGSQNKKEPGWWTLPVAESCWNGDKRDLQQ